MVLVYLSCHGASHCTAAACCDAAALQALSAEVDALKTTNTTQAAAIATYVAEAANSERQTAEIKDAYEVSHGRVLQLLLLSVCPCCTVRTSS
jgi:ribosomal protein L18